MSKLREMISQIDDDYLTGLSNKGIVKRSYKDLETSDVSLKNTADAGDSFTVKVDECTCELLLPLGESKCSCPSRSICKHIVMSILYVKNMEGQSEPLPEASHELEVKKEQGTAKSNEIQKESGLEWNEIKSYPLQKIKKQLGVRAFKTLWEHIQIEPEPEIMVTSIITVYFPTSEITVKLLEPVEYSTCTCHKKELCLHKAQAILCYQLKTGMLTGEQIEAAIKETEEETFDMEAVHSLAGSMESMLSEIIWNGISRLSKEMVHSCERMAVMSHNENLAEYEKMFRSLGENLDLYFRRYASFDMHRLMLSVSEGLHKARQLKQTKSSEEAALLAGKMRSEYILSRPLSLMGMGSRHFKSQTGYEGETFYFLEENSGDWYTYTMARPVYYDNPKIRNAYAGQNEAPWNMHCRLEEISNARILLKSGKVNEENRLSATKEAVGEIIGKTSLQAEAVRQHLYDDFLKLFDDVFGSWQDIAKLRETDKLVLVKPEKVLDAKFDEIAQEFSMCLLDKEGRRLLVKVSYSKEENYTIRYLERLYRRIGNGKKKTPLFFGIVYLEEGCMKMYPIEDYEEE